jgi:molybdenum cofactor synthesis domain-containing protein
VLTVSDRASRGVYTDEAGPLVRRMIVEAGGRIVAIGLVPDEREQIASTLIAMSEDPEIDLIVTTGGTGLGPRDVTPEATREVIEREAPGIAEAMRATGLQITPNASLSRQVCGTRDRTLIVNLPGSPKAAAESLGAVLGILPHAVEMLRA